jgi:hypothetical protein
MHLVAEMWYVAIQTVNGQHIHPTALGTPQGRRSLRLMSQLWLLEAKPFTQEDRTEVATSVAFWLKPGTYVVGKRGHADLPIEEDKSISRKHAEITVPTSGSQPHILLKGAARRLTASAAELHSTPFCRRCWYPLAATLLCCAPPAMPADTSKYGTWASAGSTFADEERLGSEPVQVAHHHMVKFGYKSPFKLYHQASQSHGQTRPWDRFTLRRVPPASQAPSMCGAAELDSLCNRLLPASRTGCCTSAHHSDRLLLPKTWQL